MAFENIERQIDSAVVRVLTYVAHDFRGAHANAEPVRNGAGIVGKRGGGGQLCCNDLLHDTTAPRAIGAQFTRVLVRHARQIHVGRSEQLMKLRERTAIAGMLSAQQAGCRMLGSAVDEPIDLGAPPLQARMRDVVARAQRRLADLRIDHMDR